MCPESRLQDDEAVSNLVVLPWWETGEAEEVGRAREALDVVSCLDNAMGLLLSEAEVCDQDLFGNVVDVDQSAVVVPSSAIRAPDQQVPSECRVFLAKGDRLGSTLWAAYEFTMAGSIAGVGESAGAGANTSLRRRRAWAGPGVPMATMSRVPSA